jgi:hypothetical protein
LRGRFDGGFGGQGRSSPAREAVGVGSDGCGWGDTVGGAGAFVSGRAGVDSSAPSVIGAAACGEVFS